MTRLCERPGCSAPADVAYGFDAERLAVWLDHLTAPGAARAGALCRRHADAMVVPRQWTLDDRREAAPRLFRSNRPTGAGSAEELADGAPAHAPTRTSGRRRRRRATDDDTGQLAFDVLAPPPSIDDLGDETGAVISDAADADADAVEGDDPGDERAVGESAAELVDPTSPLDRPATPWRPVFDQGDDLDGLLAPRGSLLSRAFRGIPRPEH